MSRDRATGGGRGKGTRRSLSALVHGPDLVLTAVILAIAAALYGVTMTFEEVSPLLAQNIPPEWFPRLLIWTIVVLSLILPFEHLFLAHGKAGLDADRSERIKPMAALTAGLLILVVAAITLLGTFAAMVLACAALPLLWGERRWKVLVPYVVLFPAAVGLLFTRVLKVYFEPGALGFGFG